MPFYQFNHFTGRLKESTHPQPFYPISANPLQKTEPPIMLFDNINTKIAKASGPGVQQYSTLPPKMAKLYAHFQKDLEAPVFLMGGRKDKILFTITLVLLGISTASSISFLCRKAK